MRCSTLKGEVAGVITDSGWKHGITSRDVFLAACMPCEVLLCLCAMGFLLSATSKTNYRNSSSQPLPPGDGISEYNCYHSASYGCRTRRLSEYHLYAQRGDYE
ncbi:jg3419 [Pararge aegeria aegeria]|uniref:Jg3419 protein n=1 Tax=Pararge aegeria aegeria TaxID=348720 RepID=A0A8S4RT06_9NEOP|nr:jg3419 [Pararge aegeria aegeria]